MLRHVRAAGGRLVTLAASGLGVAICEPKLRLGRRRHDNHCDNCETPIGMYAGEKLVFPIDSLEPDASTSLEKLRAMLNAKYIQVCLECSAELEADPRGVEQ